VLVDSALGVELADALTASGATVALFVAEGVPIAVQVDAAATLGALLESASMVVDATIWPEPKRQLLVELDRSGARDIPIASLCLTVATTQIGSWVLVASRVCGFGYLPPLADTSVIEIAPGLDTAETAIHAAEALAATLHKQTAVVKDGSGLVAARIVCPIVNEATYALEEGVATAEGIDTAVKLGANYPRGPLEWADLMGVDVVYAIMKAMYEEYGDDRYRPAPLLHKMVLAGRTGRAAGRGFHQY